MLVWTIFIYQIGGKKNLFVISCQVTIDFKFHATHAAAHSRTRHRGKCFLSQGLEPTGFQLKDGLATRCISRPHAVSPDNSSKTKALPHLIVRHDIERVPVQGEGHVPEDGAAILHHGHCLIQHSSLQRTVHSDLQRHTRIEGRRGSGGTKCLNGCSTFDESHLLSIEHQFVCFVRCILQLPLSLQKHWCCGKLFFKYHP